MASIPLYLYCLGPHDPEKYSSSVFFLISFTLSLFDPLNKLGLSKIEG